MPLQKRMCFVPGCMTGRDTENDKSQHTKALFNVPSDEPTLQKWRRSIPSAGLNLVPSSLLCEIHFAEDALEKVIEMTMMDGSVRIIKRSKPRLKDNAIPTIFPNLPISLYQTLKRVPPPEYILKKTLLPTDSQISLTTSSEIAPKVSVNSNHENLYKECKRTPTEDIERGESSPNLPENPEHSPMLTPKLKGCFSINEFSSVIPLGSFKLSTQKLKKLVNAKRPQTILAQEIEKSINNNSLQKTDLQPTIYAPKPFSKMKSIDMDNIQILVAQSDFINPTDLQNEIITLELLRSQIDGIVKPRSAFEWSHSILREAITFVNWDLSFQIRKIVVIDKFLKFKVIIRDKEIMLDDLKKTKTFKDLNEFLQKVEQLVICQGIVFKKRFSDNCTGYVIQKEITDNEVFKNCCEACAEEMRPYTRIDQENGLIIKLAKHPSPFKVDQMNNKVMRTSSNTEGITTEENCLPHKSNLMGFSPIPQILKDNEPKPGATMETRVRRCAACGIKTRYTFRCPMNDNKRLNEWAKFIYKSNRIFKPFFLCRRHFNGKDFRWNGKLTVGAIPSKYPPQKVLSTLPNTLPANGRCIINPSHTPISPDISICDVDMNCAENMIVDSSTHDHVYTIAKARETEYPTSHSRNIMLTNNQVVVQNENVTVVDEPENSYVEPIVVICLGKSQTETPQDQHCKNVIIETVQKQFVDG